VIGSAFSSPPLPLYLVVASNPPPGTAILRFLEPHQKHQKSHHMYNICMEPFDIFDDPGFNWKRTCFSGVKAKNRGQTLTYQIYQDDTLLG